MDAEDLEDTYENANSSKERQMIGGTLAKQQGSKDVWGSGSALRPVYGQAYAEQRTFRDIQEDLALYDAMKGAKNADLHKEIVGMRNKLNKLRQQLGVGRDDAAIMEEIRTKRREYLGDLGISVE